MGGLSNPHTHREGEHARMWTRGCCNGGPTPGAVRSKEGQSLGVVVGQVGVFGSGDANDNTRETQTRCTLGKPDKLNK